MSVRGYILVNLEPSKTKQALDTLKEFNFPEVKAVDYVTGAFDVILTVEASDLKSLVRLVTEQVRNVDGVKKTETLVAAD
jgi:DNA-binding Lrp family transcriptional regulator